MKDRSKRIGRRQIWRNDDVQVEIFETVQRDD